MGNRPTSLRRAVRWNEYDKVVRIMENAGDGAADLINEDYSPDCVLESCSRQPGNVFYFAVCNNRLKIIQLFIEKGAEAHTTGRYGETCLHAAARSNYVDAARLLLKQGCDVYATDDQGNLAIHSAVMTIYNTSNMIKFLLEEAGKKEDVNSKNFVGRTPLHEAAFIGNIECIKALLSYGADVNAQSNLGKTPLHQATKRSTVWQILIDAGADDSIADARGVVPKFVQNPGYHSS